ncbi:MAG: hypothetical protein DK306_002432 [Chloroflexi bacterium]|nr:MAG: hypothetical protein DK306_002432 [Chloroflexota bacterium]
MSPAAFYSPTRIATFVVALTLLLTVALIPTRPAERLPMLGQVAELDISAELDINVSDDEATTAARDAAAADVAPELIFDAGVRAREVAILSNTLDGVDAVRADRTLSETEQGRALDAIPDLAVGPADFLLLELSLADWDIVKLESIGLLTDLLTGNIDDAELQTVRETVEERVSSDLNDDQVRLVAALVAPRVMANVTVDERATELARATARAAIDEVTVAFAEGEVIVASGEAVGPVAASALALLPLQGAGIPGDELIAMLILALAASATLGAYLVLALPEAAASNRRMGMIALLVVAFVALARWLLPEILPGHLDDYLDVGLPLATAAVLVAALLERSLAIVVAVVIAVLAGAAAIIHPDFAPGEAPAAAQALRPLVVYLFAGVAGVLATQRVIRITQYGATGGVVGVTTFIVGLAFWLLDPHRATADLGLLAAASAASGIATSVLVIGAFSFLGQVFGIATRLQLLELAQLTQPLLLRLQEEAPGTFHHSLLVATMAERAATRISADPLLVRVGAYYHDIGKLAQPHMYIENQADGGNPHDKLDPLESAAVIQDHVRRGVELGKRYRLPEPIRAFIPEHHGTRLVTYFYRKAAQQDAAVDPGLFTYGGPRPRRKETAIVMMADSTEAVVRSSTARDEESIARLVDAVIQERLNEHQFDDCDLTLRQIQAIGESFKVTLNGVYHPRIEYPEPTEAERRRGAAPAPSGAPAPRSGAPVDGGALPILPRPGER